MAVDVMKNGDEFRGTGFVVRYNGQKFLVTCKHNVDKDEGVQVQAVTTAAGAALEIGGFQSFELDVAIARIVSPVPGPSFALVDGVEVFDEVFTLGYPRVPHAEPMMLGHRGEINAVVNLYATRCPVLILSNLVSPGSSGGPVLARDGSCVGMTINWLEGQWGNSDSAERMRFSAALPADKLREAIEIIP